MREMSVAEQMCKAVLAVIADGLALDTKGDVYASDLTCAIQEFDNPGHFVTKWEKTGADRLVAFDEQGRMYVPDPIAKRFVAEYGVVR
jgi:hypothetical protein